MRATLLLLVLSLSASLTAAPAPTTQSPGTAAPGLAPQMMLDRSRAALDELKLTPEQKTKVDTIFKEARAELEQMRTQLESMDVRERMAETREFFEGVRADLAFVLTPEQRQQMQQKFEQIRQNPGPGGPGAGALPPPGVIAERLREVIPQLKLSDEQAQRMKELFDDVRPRADALRQQVETGDAAARQKARELSEETRQKLRELLTPQQQEKLRELMRQPMSAPPPDGPRRPGGAPARRNRDTSAATRAAGPDKDQMMSETTMSGAGAGAGAGGDMMSMEGARRGDSAKPGASAPGPAAPPPGPQIGDAAPDFTLTKPDGAQVTLASMKGRVVVLVFGSYSAPTFRNRAAALEKLKSELGTRANFFIVYAREAHPTGEWEVARNKEDGISVEQARSLDARRTAAQTAREKLKLTTPILLDTIGNDTAIAYGAGINSAYVIARDGTIAARQQWFEPLALRRAIENAANAKPATRPAP
jgi:Spy/CpxP family protein refolding chaperone